MTQQIQAKAEAGQPCPRLATPIVCACATPSLASHSPLCSRCSLALPGCLKGRQVRCMCCSTQRWQAEQPKTPPCIMGTIRATHVFSMSARCAASAFHSGVLDTPVASSSATCSGCMNRHVYTQQQCFIRPLIMHHYNPCQYIIDRNVTGQGLVCTEQLDGQQAVAAAAATHRLGWRRCHGGGHDDAAVGPPAAAVPAGRARQFDQRQRMCAPQEQSKVACVMVPAWIEHAHDIPGQGSPICWVAA
jgi:hypothetical protein